MSNSTPGQKRTLSEAEMLAYTSADPFAMTSEKPWEMELSSKFLRNIAIGWVILVMIIHIFMGITLDIEFTGASVTGIDKFAFPGVGVVVSILSWIALNRPRLRANEDGVEIRNIIGTRFYPWFVIYGLSFPEGARMARLELPEFEYVPIWAIQSGDKEKAIDAVREFRKLEARYMPED
ncbi:Bacterial PH domain [Corynebacterium camporealensis]|uniref:Bacterial PH domain n=1 Tax=Corynebacterium camporealensis TaxID=161896 RepID=A0A0F6QW51_9CORY|nr:PH domain-containing protein [Corynebacterium camporealensis]AKE39227.1 Bacterial PH domain [Corynebacterium camporealensis]AVH88419.1 Bacterial PH domain [Corynebacterium camporealensis]